jgi:hypothetical protein
LAAGRSSVDLATIFRRALEHDNVVLAEITARRSTGLGRRFGGAT